MFRDRWHLPDYLSPAAEYDVRSFAESAWQSTGILAAWMPDSWEKRGEWILGILVIVLAQSFLITGLLINRARRKRFEAALQEGEERYREVVESQTELICRYLPDTTLTFANEAYC